MTIYEFTVELVQAVDSDEQVERLYGSIDDGTMSTCNGVSKIDFDREASSLRGAIRSAIADVERCGFHVAKVWSGETELIDEINSSLAATAAD